MSLPVQNKYFGIGYGNQANLGIVLEIKQLNYTYLFI
jgi:hypothetical protein